MTTFWETMLLLKIKRQEFLYIFFNWSEMVSDLDPEPERKLFQSRIRNRNKSLHTTTPASISLVYKKRKRNVMVLF
jgi:hypothetical protein